MVTSIPALRPWAPALSLVQAPPLDALLELSGVKEWVLDTATPDEFNLGALVRAAVAQVENDTRRALLSQTWDQAIDRFPRDSDPLPILVGPLQSVTSVTVYSSTDQSSTWSASNYFVDTYRMPGRLCLKSGATWPADTRDYVAGVVRVVAGYGSTEASVPEPLKQAVRALVAHWWDNRSAVEVGTITKEVEFGYQALIGPYVVHYVGDEVRR